MPLTDVACRNAKPGEGGRPRKLFDGGGLYLLVKPVGKYWRFDYRFAGKYRTLALGVYPDVPLATQRDKAGQVIEGARDKLAQAKALLAAGTDPGGARKVQKLTRAQASETGFEAVAREWHGKHTHRWAESTGDKILDQLEKWIFPWLGARPVNEVTAPELLAALRRIENTGALETAHRVKQNCGRVFRYAIATGRAERDPAADLTGALPPAKVTHHAAVTTPAGIGQLMRAIDGFTGTFIVKTALQLAPLLFVRPGELRQAEWAEFELPAARWVIPAARMKMGVEHIVPLSTQAVALLKDLHPLTGHGRLVFPGVRDHDRPMSENTLNQALRRLGYGPDEMTSHGFRSIASTMLNEQGWNRDAIERQLAHAERNQIRGAYNRAEFLPERVRMMQAWADYLDALKKGAEVVPIGTGTRG